MMNARPPTKGLVDRTIPQDGPLSWWLYRPSNAAFAVAFLADGISCGILAVSLGDPWWCETLGHWSRCRCGLVAQLVERSTVNRVVAGSIPAESVSLRFPIFSK
jgi:hypothetical protein